MAIDRLIERVSAAITRSITDQDAEGKLEELTQLRADIVDAQSTDAAATGELSELVLALDSMIEMAQDPMLSQVCFDALQRDTEPRPALFDAIDDGDLAAVQAELKNCDVNQRVGEFDSTPLYCAMSNLCAFSVAIIDCLLDAGADPKLGLTQSNVLQGLGFSVIRDDTPEEVARIVARCVAGGANIEQRSDALGWTPLITAAAEWNPIACEALLMAGADITARAGEVDGVCFAGQDCFAFANGDPKTLAVLKQYATRH